MFDLEPHIIAQAAAGRRSTVTMLATKISTYNLLYGALVLTYMHQSFAEYLNPIAIPGDGNGICSSQEEREAARGSISSTVQAVISRFGIQFYTVPNCGAGEWQRVAYLNMSDPAEQCPSPWLEYSNNGARGCGRQNMATAVCNDSEVHYASAHQLEYSKVCGRIIGYQIGDTDGLVHTTNAHIDNHYISGVGITHGTPRQHIWSFAAHLSESNGQWLYQCPCANPTDSRVPLPAPFMGNNYYCESGNPNFSFQTPGQFFDGDPLWDGEQCEGECCSNGRSPPWFSVNLPNPTTDDIDVRICAPHSSDLMANTPIKLMEIYVQ